MLESSQQFCIKESGLPYSIDNCEKNISTSKASVQQMADFFDILIK